MSKLVPQITLHDNKTIPQLGFGVWQIPDGDTKSVVAQALKVGYRHIDTAMIYNNEEGVGKAIAESGIARKDIYLTTKLWSTEQGYDSTLRAFDASLSRLGLEYVDLYLIHWPAAVLNKYVDTFKAFQKLKSDGLIQSIGVSNFYADTLDRLIAETGETPVLNQIELHPYLTQTALVKKHKELGIITQAWSPLGQGGDLLNDPIIAEIAREIDKTVAQVILRWHIDIGNVVIPKSVTPARIVENFNIFDFKLSKEQIAKISALHKNHRIGPDPHIFTGL